MEAEPLLPEKTPPDPTKPPPELLPKLDFTEVDQSPTLVKPTFKNALQAKKRLQAFSSSRPGSTPLSPQKTKPNSEEKPEEVKKLKKGHTHEDKAKAVIKEIEELKKEEQAYFELQRHSKRSRSRSTEGRFKKVAKKSRNYRRRSSSPERPRKSPKKQKKYPRNWREFYDIGATFEVNREFDVPTPTGNNELLRQVLFESPSLPIVTFKMKTINREDKIVPFEFMRFTRTKPVLRYSVNFGAVKEMFLGKKLLLEALPKHAPILEKLYSNSAKFAGVEIDPKIKKSKVWYPKFWSASETECKVLEKSVGLSFLQSYAGEEEENDIDEVKEKKKSEENCDEKKKAERESCEQKKEISEDKKKKEKVEHVENEEKRKDENVETCDEKKKKKEKVETEEKKKKKEKVETEEKKKKEEKDEHVEPREEKKKRDVEISDEKKKKDEKKEHESCEKKIESLETKKKKKKRKEKTKETAVEPTKKKKKKDKTKKGKKKKKKPKEKKKDKVEKNTKQQVIDELKEIEEKLAKKREDKEKKKHSEDETKKPEPKEEHALKNKLKKMEADPSVEKKPKEVKISRKRKSRWSDEVLSTSDLKIVEEIAKSETSVTDLIEEIKADTPDTDEYHSHWESDDDVSSSVPRNSLKLNRSWESDEELFERSHNREKKPAETYANLEIPLNINIKNFSRRSWEEKPFSVAEELKLLEKERRCLSEERKKLELEKKKIMQLHEEAKLERLDEDTKRSPFTPENLVKIKKEKPEIDFSIDSLNNSLLSNVSSTESNFPVGVLENQYEEFIKAVTTESGPKKRELTSDSSWSSDSDHKKKKRKKKKKKKKKARECEGLLLGKSNIFNEFDIPVPSDLPEMVPTPVPVPSPIVPLDKILPLTTPPTLAEKSPETPKSENKPFVFSSILLPLKKSPLVDNSNLKLDDTDSDDFTEKFKKPEDDEKAEPEEKDVQPTESEKPEPEPVKPDVVDVQNVPLPPEKATLSDKTKRSRSLSPRKSKPKRRSRSISRDRDSKRRSPIRRREPTPPRRRYASPRRRSPPRRRGSPWRRSPSPRRRRRRSPSFSPLRRNGRKRTPSPRRNSPLDGFKKSVADSTISDDMLPQPNPDDYSDSPRVTYYGKIKGSVSPQASPRRIPLDDRINQVLGLEKEGAPLTKTQEVYPNYNYGNAYGQYPPFNQYGPKNEYVAQPYGPMMYTQPPPPVKPVPPTKVLQVGNILQVVPTDEVPSVIETKTPERSQQIVQVGNMLQIVPAVISTPKPIPEPQPVSQPPVPEKPSAETLMKQKNAERKAEREKRRQERDRRRKEKEQKRKEREKRKQLKLKLKTENMIKRAIQIETEALANDELEEEEPSADSTPVTVIISTTPSCKSILLQGGSKKRKSVQFADGVRPGEGTSPSGGEELSSPPPPKLPKEKRYKKKTKKRKVRVKVVKKVQNQEEEDEEDEEDGYYANMAPPPPPPGSPPPHVFPARVKTHTVNNVHPYVGNIIQSNSPGFPFPPPMQVVMNSRHQPPPAYIPGAYPTDNSLSHPTYQGVSSHQ